MTKVNGAVEQTCTMIVVDDIKAVVNGIVNQLDWQGHGIDIVGTAADGESGLALLQSRKPDIILTDIRMPRMSGIEMTKQMVEQLPGSKIIFISGYNDFENAQQAIQLGAFDYLLKPFRSRQLLETVLRARDEILKERARKQSYLEMEYKLKESMPLLRQEYLSMLVRYAADPEAIDRRWEFLGIAMDEGPIAVLVLEIDHEYAERTDLTMREIELTRFTIQNIVEETIRSRTKGVVFRDGPRRFVCLINVGSEEQPIQVAEQCVSHVAMFSKCTVSIGIGTLAKEKHELVRAYREAVEALSYTFFTGGNSVFDYRNIALRNNAAAPKIAADQEKELLYGILSGNAERTGRILGQLYAEWDGLAGYLSPQQAKTQYADLAAVLLKSLGSAIKEADAASYDEQIRALAFRSMNVRDIQQSLKDMCLAWCRLIQSNQRANAQMTIDESIAYIRDNVHENLSVGGIAERAHLSPSYFANLFKKITGVSVMQFVLGEKMAKAKSLLAGSKLSIQEVSDALGYEERSYFSEVFKKHTGLTPKEFKNNYSNEG